MNLQVTSKRIAVVVGGAFQAVAALPEIVRADTVVYVDVAREIFNVSPSGKIVPVILAQGETIKTLLTKCENEGLITGDRLKEVAKKMLQNHPGALLADGLNQTPALGFLAVAYLEKNGLEKLLVEKVFQPIFRLANATLQEVEILVFSSQAGGTGSGAANKIARLLVKVINERTAACAKVVYYRLGSITYDGLGPNIYPNIAGVLNLLDEVYDSGHPQEIRRAILVELPPLEGDKLNRDRLTAQLIQTLCCPQVEKIYWLRNSNDAVNSPWGALTILKPSWYGQIAPLRVRAGAARYYGPRIQQLLDSVRPNVNVCQGIEVHPRLSHEDFEDLEDVVESIRRSPQAIPPELEERSKGYISFSADVITTFINREPLSVNEMLAGYSDLPRNVAEFRKVASSGYGLLLHLRRALESKGREEKGANARLKQAEKELNKAIEMIYPTTFISKVVSSFVSASQKLNNFRNRVNRYRQQAKVAAEIQAVTEALRGVIARVKQDVDAYLGRLEKLRDGLKEISDLSQDYVGEGSIVFKPMDRVLYRLLVASRLGNGKVELELDRVVEFLTLAGLGQMLEITNPTPEAIVDHVLNHKAEYNSPLWGGSTNSKEPISDLLILPPVSEETRAKLEYALRTVNSSLSLTKMDRADAGVGIMTLKIYRVDDPGEEIFTQLYELPIKEVFGDGNGSTAIPALHAPSGAPQGVGKFYLEKIIKEDKVSSREVT